MCSMHMSVHCALNARKILHTVHTKLCKCSILKFLIQNGLMSSTENLEHWRIAQDEETFSKELTDLLQAISELEGRVEEVRNGVIIKKDKIMLNEVGTTYPDAYKY